MSLTEDKIYEEVGETYRFFAKWRQLAFAGYLAVLAGAMSFTNSAVEHQYSPILVAFCFILVAAIGVIFWIADRRTHCLTLQAIEAGKKLEADKGGFFTVNTTHDGLPPPGRWERRFRHSWAANALFLGSAGVLTALAIFVCVIGLPTGSHSTVVWEYKVIAFQGTVTNDETQLNQLARDGWVVVFHSISPEPVPAPYCSFILGRPKK